MNPILQHALTSPRSRNVIPAVLRKHGLPALKPACLVRLLLLLWAARQQEGLGQERSQMIMRVFFQFRCRKSQSQLEIPLEETTCKKFNVFWLYPKNRRFNFFSAFTVAVQTLLWRPPRLCSPSHSKSDPSDTLVFLPRLSDYHHLSQMM